MDLVTLKLSVAARVDMCNTCEQVQTESIFLDLIKRPAAQQALTLQLSLVFPFPPKTRGNSELGWYLFIEKNNFSVQKSRGRGLVGGPNLLYGTNYF